jgi:hypothetical protein
MAIPGEVACRIVADCGSPPWGDIPIDAATRFVDASYAGGDGDGSEARPFTTLEQAFNAAAPGALIALAAGSYQAYFDFLGKPVRLWGRCPELVEIVGTDPAFGSLIVGGAAARGTEVHTLAVRGAGPGVLVYASTVLLDRLWIHDTGSTGISSQIYQEAADVTVEGSLVERAQLQGVYVDGSRGVVRNSVVRDTQPQASDGAQGYGFFALPGTDGSASQLELTGSLVERNHTFAVLASGADAVIEGVAMRDTLLHQPSQREGYGAGVHPDPMTQRRGSLVMRASTVERCQEAGLLVASSDATIEWSVIRDTLPRPDGQVGRGVGVQWFNGIDTPANITLRESTLNHNAEFGIAVLNSNATLERVAILDTVPDGRGSFGDGIAVSARQLVGVADIVVTQSRIFRSARAGAASFGASMRLGSNLFQCNPIQMNGEKAFTFEDLGANRCECGDAVVTCQVVSTNLAAPESGSIQ